MDMSASCWRKTDLNSITAFDNLLLGIRWHLESHNKTEAILHYHNTYKANGHGGPVVRSRLRGRRVPCSKPISTEAPPWNLLHAKYYVDNQMPSRPCAEEVSRGRCQLSCRPWFIITASVPK
ncbi:hypothetical protein AVEN_138243-1 [Araneus ventricosus]|uniref:Uncharacterized protein n=1 Tax=Araneus ventricosus TaxID=182803 RepID=A0A4Y2IQJ0_ARAVE|nr:hypothetical protein AVEN_138243-1 [Araneus ventricosus]